MEIIHNRDNNDDLLIGVCNVRCRTSYENQNDSLNVEKNQLLREYILYVLIISLKFKF